MATTPEGKIKTKVKQLLDNYRVHVYTYMVVPGGYGAPTLDWFGAVRGQAFAIEAKAPGKKPTLRQETIIRNMERGGVTVFIINDEAGLEVLDAWLAGVIRCQTSHTEPTSRASPARDILSKPPTATTSRSPTRT
jgi:hypothetical protein